MRRLSLVLSLLLVASSLVPAWAQQETTDAPVVVVEESAPEEAVPESQATPVPALPATQAPAPTAPPAAASEADVAARAAPSVVRVIVGNAEGSGVKIDRGILTSEHVVSGANQVRIITGDGVEGRAVVSRAESRSDLALLLTETPLPALELEPARLQRQGDPILVMGYPLGERLSGPPTLSRGVISALREIDGVQVVQTDASLNSGNSGGAVVNLRGKLIGVVSFRVRGTEGLNFAISSEAVEEFLSAPASSLTSPGPTPRPTPVPGDPGSSLIGQTTSVCEGDLRLELTVEDSFMASDGTVWVVARTTNTGGLAGNLLLKLRLYDDRDQSFNMVNPRDSFVLGPLYNEIVRRLRTRGFEVSSPDTVMRPGQTVFTLFAFLARPDARAFRLVPDSPCR